MERCPPLRRCLSTSRKLSKHSSTCSGPVNFLSDTLVMQPSAISMLGLPLRRTPTLNDSGHRVTHRESIAVLKTPRCCGPSAITGPGICYVSASTTSSVIGHSKRVTADHCRRGPGGSAGGAQHRRNAPYVVALANHAPPAGQPGQLVVLAFGKHGGRELKLLQRYRSHGRLQRRWPKPQVSSGAHP